MRKGLWEPVLLVSNILFLLESEKESLKQVSSTDNILFYSVMPVKCISDRPPDEQSPDW